MRLILAGATGLVGRHVLARALAEPRVHRVVAPTRRPLPAHPKLDAPVVDFDHPPEDADWWHADTVICALGTTMKTAGSRAAFRRVDHDYPLTFARLAQRHGTPTYVLNSAMGADARSRVFYNRVKGELEAELRALGFTSLTLVRPGLIGGDRDERRLGETLATHVLRTLHPLLPTKWRINPAERIADALLAAALDAPAGVHVIGSDALA
ncbi:NAD(P)H-binding protein [Luteimonas sp. WGS1318]|uniref:NAD(P)H-binding protein n=1 Tax=Luteimonas sp. WGS1318 TaxID=3366815 RepID=UPI00372CF27B